MAATRPVSNTSIESSRIAQSIGTALDRFIKNNQDQFQYASGELSQLHWLQK
jgi:fructose-1,6-bisphosphatase I